MSLKGVGNLFVLGFEGTSVPEWVKSFAERFGLGGAILFKRNCPDARTVREITNALSILCEPAPLVMVDQEGGRVERLKEGVTSLPSAREMAQLPAEELFDAACRQGRELKALGINVNLAPVCDVVRPGESGAIGDRGFGTAPETVTRAALAWVKGARKAGIQCAAKHFPGHGASPVDTHLGAGVVARPREELYAVDLPPFAALVKAGVELVMACHLSYPDEDQLPACYSPYWLNEVLRNRLGFKGAIITDDMEMGAIADAGEPARLALKAVDAGADLLIYGRMLNPSLNVFKVAEYLEKALDGKRLQEALARVNSLRAAR